MSYEQEPKDPSDSEDQIEIEDWQYEHSIKLSDDFTDNIRDIVESFDFDNDDDKYVAGTATLDLWCKLTAILGEIGYDDQELSAMVTEYIDLDRPRVLH